MDHAYNTSRMRHGAQGDLLGDDPYCDLYKEIIADAMVDLTGTDTRTGGNGEPRLLRRMGHRPNKPPQELTVGGLALATIPST